MHKVGMIAGAALDNQVQQDAEGQFLFYCAALHLSRTATSWPYSVMADATAYHDQGQSALNPSYCLGTPGRGGGGFGGAKGRK